MDTSEPLMDEMEKVTVLFKNVQRMNGVVRLWVSRSRVQYLTHTHRRIIISAKSIQYYQNGKLDSKLDLGFSVYLSRGVLLFSRASKL